MIAFGKVEYTCIYNICVANMYVLHMHVASINGFHSINGCGKQPKARSNYNRPTARMKSTCGIVQTEINKLTAKVQVAEIHCKTYTRTVKK